MQLHVNDQKPFAVQVQFNLPKDTVVPVQDMSRLVEAVWGADVADRVVKRACDSKVFSDVVRSVRRQYTRPDGSRVTLFVSPLRRQGKEAGQPEVLMKLRPSDVPPKKAPKNTTGEAEGGNCNVLISYAFNVQEKTSSRSNALAQVGTLAYNRLTGEVTRTINAPMTQTPRGLSDINAMEALQSELVESIRFRSEGMDAIALKSMIEGLAELSSGFQSMGIGNTWVIPSWEGVHGPVPGASPDAMDPNIGAFRDLGAWLSQWGMRVVVIPFYAGSGDDALSPLRMARRETEEQHRKRLEYAAHYTLKYVTRSSRTGERLTERRARELDELLRDARVWEASLQVNLEDNRARIAAAHELLKQHTLKGGALTEEEIRTIVSTSGLEVDYDEYLSRPDTKPEEVEEETD